jgi:drug/metabolite transporter (DMT)-like permease
MPPIPSNALYALLAAAFWGTGDFSGGMSVKSAPAEANPTGAALRVVLFSHLTSFSVLIALALVFHQPIPHGRSLAWGITAGILGGSSLAAFYMALSRGAMGASAAISGLLAAAIPSTIDILLEGSPGPHRLLGFLIAGIAIWLIAAGPAQKEERSTILLALFAGIGFGLYFAALKFAAAHSAPLWTMASARIGSISACALTLLFFKLRPKNSAEPKPQSKDPVILSEAKDPCISPFVPRHTPATPIHIPRRMILWILSTALFDTSGNLLFVIATRAGRLDIASVLASLYPAGTILLAAATLGERPTPRQLTGMAIAAAAVVLITL